MSTEKGRSHIAWVIKHPAESALVAALALVTTTAIARNRFGEPTIPDKPLITEQAFRQAMLATPVPQEIFTIRDLEESLNNYIKLIPEDDFPYSIRHIGLGRAVVLATLEGEDSQIYIFPLSRPEFAQPIKAGTQIPLVFRVGTQEGTFLAFPHPKGDGWRFIDEDRVEKLSPPPGIV